MGVARLSDRRIPFISKTDIYYSDILSCQNGVVVYVHTTPRGTYCRSERIRGSGSRSLGEAYGLLYATGQ